MPYCVSPNSARAHLHARRAVNNLPNPMPHKAGPSCERKHVQAISQLFLGYVRSLIEIWRIKGEEQGQEKGRQKVLALYVAYTRPKQSFRMLKFQPSGIFENGQLRRNLKVGYALHWAPLGIRTTGALYAGSESSGAKSCGSGAHSFLQSAAVKRGSRER